MTKIRLALAAALLAGAAVPALAVDTKPTINTDATTAQQAAMPQTRGSMPAPNSDNAQAGLNDTGNNAAPNTQMAMNTPSGSSGMGISSDPSPTQRKATRTASARAKADAAEAETTKQLNQQAAELAKPSTSVQ